MSSSRERLYDQIVDELIARRVAIEELGLAVPTRTAGQDRVAVIAEAWCDSLLDGAHATSVAAIRRALFPNGAPEPSSSWWRTPLGLALGPG